MITKNDFIELEFAARIKDGELFDTNMKKEAEKAKLNIESFPLIISVGHGMIIKGFDKSLEGKEIEKDYTEEFSPEDAFGNRNPALVRMLPMKIFTEQKIFPQTGMQLTLDGMLVKIISVSGGRVLADFNNPLAGKKVVYNFKIKRKVEDINEKINALQDFFFRKKLEFSVNGKEITFKVPKEMEKFISVFEKPFEDILGMKIKAEILEKKEIQEKPIQKTEETQEKEKII